MGVWRRLRAIDDRVVTRRNARYDRPPPMWVTTSGMTGLLLYGSILLMRGNVAAVAAGVTIAAAWVVYAIAVVRWGRKHRRPRQEEFEIATDRDG